MADAIADVCIVGVGGMGGIIAKELASAGLKVVGFERGPAPKREDYAPRDSIRFLIRPACNATIARSNAAVRHPKH